MTTAEITAAIKAALEKAGINTPGDTHGDDSTALVVVRPERNWSNDGACFVGIWEDRVQRYQRDVPYNSTHGRAVGAPIFYNTPDEMVAAVKNLQGAPTASCWK